MLRSVDQIRREQIADVRRVFRYVVVRGWRVFVGVPWSWRGHDEDDVRHEIDGMLYVDVTSALDSLIGRDEAELDEEDEDPYVDAGSVEEMLEFDRSTHAAWYAA